jgi:tellurite resistance protein TerC
LTLAGRSPELWLLFVVAIAALLLIDLLFIARKPSTSIKRSIWWSAATVAAAGLFGAVIWSYDGRPDALRFATGYLVEFSLSIDNLLVFIIVLHYFAVPVSSRPTVLKWGILGAIVMRGIVIAAGTAILREFHWVIYLFGGLLIVTAARMLIRPRDPKADLGRNPIVRLSRRILPISDGFAGKAFFVRTGGRLHATPLLLVVLVIEWTDLFFATDSIPAIFAITRDPFLIYTSNVFAIVGLRALFFVLAALLARAVYLRFGVATILILVGVKMLLADAVAVPTVVSLAVIVGVLGMSVLLSPRKTSRR